MLDRSTPRAGMQSYIFIVLSVCILKSIIVLSAGFLYGRVSVPPVYDDVTYFVDAMERMRILLDQGLWSFARGLLTNPPHAPYPSMAALIGFLFSGSNPAAPYFINGLTMGLLTAFLLFLFRAQVLTVWLVAVVTVATPWFDWAVTIFHPDLVAGYAAAVIAAALIWQNEIMDTPRRAILVGVAAALVLLMKPVAIAMVVAIWGLACLLGAVISLGERRTFMEVAKRLVFGAIPIVIISGPYFALEIGNIIRYVYLGFVTERETWSHRLTASEHDFYYVRASVSFFGYWFYYAIAGGVVALVVGASRRDWGTAFRFGSLLLVCFAAYLVPASVEVKHPFYGGVLYGCIAVCLLLSICYIADRVLPFVSLSWAHALRRLPAGWEARRGFLAAVALVALAGMSDGQMRFGPDVRHTTQIVYDGVYRFISDELWSRPVSGAGSAKDFLVYFATPTPVPPHAFRFRGLTDGLDIRFAMATHESDLKLLVDVAKTAAMVVVPDAKYSERIYPYPVMKLLPDFRAWLAANNRLKLAGTVRTEFGNVDVYSDHVPRE